MMKIFVRITAASTSVVRLTPAPSASPYTSRAAASAPANAAGCTALGWAGHKAAAHSAASPAPAFTPITLGLAMALFSTACSKTPAAASALPANSPARVRGQRTCSKTR